MTRNLIFLFLYLASVDVLAEEQLLVCNGEKTVTFINEGKRESKLDGEWTLVINGNMVEWDDGKAEMSKKSSFLWTWRTLSSLRTHWTLNTISRRLEVSVGTREDDGSSRPILVHFYNCRRVKERLIE